MTGAPADPFNLNRFLAAQEDLGMYERAVGELRDGRKTSHWMWYVFPQVAGLGNSPDARRYAIASLAEARAYLAHPILGPRLVECASIVAATEGRSLAELLGYPDDLKLRSSMTLFLRADPTVPAFAAVLDRYYDGAPDPLTDQLLATPPPPSPY